MSLHLRVNSQLSKSRSSRLAPLSFLLGGIARPCCGLPTGGRWRAVSDCQQPSCAESEPKENQTLALQSALTYLGTLPFSRLSKACDYYRYRSVSSGIIQEGSLFPLQANSLYCLSGHTKPPLSSSNRPRCLCLRPWYICSCNTLFPGFGCMDPAPSILRLSPTDQPIPPSSSAASCC